MKGLKINNNVLSMVVCSGCIDLFHLCKVQQYLSTDIVCRASEFCHISLLVFILENGSDINAKNENNSTPHHYAAEKGHLSVIEYLVNHGSDINAKNTYNETPLHSASENGHLGVVEYLVNQKADINIMNDSFESPLHFACYNLHFGIVDYLINHGADYSEGIKGESLLHWASRYGYHSVVKCIMQKKI